MRIVLLLSLCLVSVRCIGSDRTESAATERKASEIIFPTIDTLDTPVQDVLAYLQQKSKELDPEKKGVSIVLTLGDGSYKGLTYKPKLLTLSFKYIPLLEALKYIAFLGEVKFRIHKDSIIIVPLFDTWTFPKLYDSNDWQRKAVARYPDLGISGTRLNSVFIQEYQKMKGDTALFSKADWPMLMAARLAYKMPNLRPPGAEAEDPFEYNPPPPSSDPKQSIAAAGGSAAQVAKKSFPSVAMLIMSDENNQPVTQGSGFVVATNIVATNNHVVKGKHSGVVKFVGDNKIYKITKVLSVDEDADLALVGISAPEVPPLPIGPDAPPEPGDEIYVIGAPKGFEGTFSKGNISGLRRLDNTQLLQITAPISPGSSGGPVMNTNGEVVGVAVSTFAEGQNLNFAVPVQYIRRMFKKR